MKKLSIKQMKKAFDEYEKQELRNCDGMERAEDLEKKLSGSGWYRVYRWRTAGIVKCICWVDSIVEGYDFIKPNEHATESELELIAAASAFWMMQENRRRAFLETHLSIYDQPPGGAFRSADEAKRFLSIFKDAVDTIKASEK
jgi:hypothetical protein